MHYSDGADENRCPVTILDFVQLIIFSQFQIVISLVWHYEWWLITKTLLLYTLVWVEFLLKPLMCNNYYRKGNFFMTIYDNLSYKPRRLFSYEMA